VSTLLALLSVGFIVLVLQDAFEVMILPRRVTRPYRFARYFYRYGWRLWRWLTLWLPAAKRRENFLAMFGPLSLLALIGGWMLGLIVGFALLHWSLGTPLNPGDTAADLSMYLYLSGASFSTLGFGDVTAAEPLGRLLTIVEACLGFGFLACVIGYLPVLYQAFSRREVAISLLDARAGSPPSASQLLLRAARAGNAAAVLPFLAEWERWSAEVLESHLSDPLLAYYRSQHDNQSWVAALTTILDTCALLIAGVKSLDPYQAQLTFAMARHAVVDLAMIFQIPPQPVDEQRLRRNTVCELCRALQQEGWEMREGEAVAAKLAELHAMYAPFVDSLSRYFLLTLPVVVPERVTVDNWQTSAWTRRAPGFSKLPPVEGDEHFD
jgi:hypothetical protein